ncbi:MAG: chemotaxis protein [Desulfobulbus propionicus]|nr:MAG: chemotaxis protein [Desulfobulbus propionicus]
MKNFKIGVKLTGGFALTAIIILIVGIISIFEQNRLYEKAELLEKEAVQSIKHIMVIKNEASRVATSMRTILTPYITQEQRKHAKKELLAARKIYAKAREEFSRLAFFNTVPEEWQQFVINNGKWVKANNTATKLSEELLEADILNPEQLTRDMIFFEAAHERMLKKVSLMLMFGTSFAGGTDATNCALGKWLKHMPTTNPEIVAAMQELQPIHTKLHQTIGQIKDMAAEGKIEQGKVLMQNTLLPLSSQLFTITARISTLVDKYHNTFKEMNKILLVDTVRHQTDTFRALDSVVGKAVKYAEEIGSSAEATARTGKTMTLIGIVTGIILALVLGVVLTLLITRPLSEGIELAKVMSEGDMTKTIDIEQKDEIGLLANALNNMAQNLRKMLAGVGQEVTRVDDSSRQLAAISDQMASGAEDTANRSSQVAAAAEEMSANQSSVAAAMEEASVNVNMVATATEEMKATITEISENSGRAKQITAQAVEKSRIASERVDELGKAAHEINKVTEAITEISEQTNLLALNATIEAARAGEAGKGFAVVANEIKDLAGQTAKATLDIQSKIQGIQQATGITVKEINEISTVITEVDQVVATIATAVEEQSATTGEIVENVVQGSQGISEVNENVAQITSVSSEIAAEIAGVNTSANEMTTSSREVKDTAKDLASVADKLKNMVTRFKV